MGSMTFIFGAILVATAVTLVLAIRSDIKSGLWSKPSPWEVDE